MNKHIEQRVKPTLDELLDDVQVTHRDQMVDGSWLPEDFCWIVEDGNSTLAIFPSERSALQYRLAIINQRLNNGWDTQ